MHTKDNHTEINLANLGDEMYRLISDLYPICRSITGDGVRETLAHLQRIIPVVVHGVQTGTAVFDWTVPKEWNIRDAYVKNSKGERVIDFQKSNLNVLNYSTPVQGVFSLAELREHLFSMPEYPEWIPYRTSYYNERWGFCLTDRQLQQMQEDEYEVCIDADLSDGQLNYGEYFIPGESDDEVLFFTHICHPSLCNDNLSGIAVASFLARHLALSPRRLSYRIIFAPATIGSITWLAQNQAGAANIKYGLVLANLADDGHVHYKKSRRENAEIDNIVQHVLRESKDDFEVIDFSPYGYDERQFCSPGFNLPVGRFTRSPNGGYPEYHTSADNLDFIEKEKLVDSLSTLFRIIQVIENNVSYVNNNPFCEPQLGRRGIYHALGGMQGIGELQHAMLWILNLSDGTKSLLEIAQKSEMPFAVLLQAAELLHENALITKTPQITTEPLEKAVL